MKSIIRRLEALEASVGVKSLVLLVGFEDGSEKTVCFSEFKELAKQHPGYGFSARIISGDNLKEFDECLDIMIGAMADIANNPAPNRNIEDYE